MNKKDLNLIIIIFVIIIVIIISSYICKLMEQRRLLNLKVDYLETAIEEKNSQIKDDKEKSNIKVDIKNDSNEVEEMVKEIIDYKKSFLASNGNLDINSDLVQKAYKKVLNCNSFYPLSLEETESTEGGSFYKDKKVTLSNLSNFEKLLIVLENLPDKENLKFEEIDLEVLKKINLIDEEQYIGGYEGIKVYTKDDILKTSKEVFGKNVDIELMDLTNVVGHTYMSFGDKYYSISAYGGGYGYPEIGYSNLEYAIENENTITLFDQYIYYVDNMQLDYVGRGFYKESSKINFIDDGDFISDSVEKELIFWKYNEQLNRYKHTFKKNEETNDYYWVSTEIVK